MQLINDRRSKREKEAKIRIAAQKAAREVETLRRTEDKQRESKRREKEEKLLSAEIHRLKSQLQKQQEETQIRQKLETTKKLQQVQREAADRRKLQEERRRQVENKIRLEAKNKIIIHERIEKFRKENLYIKRRYFIVWSSILVQRRKQFGVAAACYDWRTTKIYFGAWRRHLKKRRDIRMIEFEKQRAKTIQKFRYKAVEQKTQLILCKFFQAWRIHAKREAEKRHLLQKESETQKKMENLISKIKHVGLSNVTKPVETDIDVSQVIPVTARTPRPKPAKSTIRPIQAWQVNANNAQNVFIKNERENSTLPNKNPAFDPYENRHKQQLLVINEQTRRLQLQTQTIHALSVAKNAAIEKELQTLETSSLPNPANLSRDKKCNNTQINIKSIVKPHKSVLNMEKRNREREMRRVEVEKIKKQREIEKIDQMECERNERIEKARKEKEKKKAEIVARKHAEELKREEKEAKAKHNAANIAKADVFFKTLLQKRVINAFRQNVDNTRNVNEKVVNILRCRRIAPYFNTWITKVRSMNNERIQRADSCRYRHLMQRSLQRWYSILAIEERHVEIALTHCRRSRMSRVLRQWSQSIIDAKVNEWRNTKEAQKHRNTHLLKTALRQWTRLKAENAKEAERETRRIKLRALVKEVLPDY